mmetsp:Transcript_19617/g.38862  ORF Transcript_19617/g.38862 Transcript_19617/m.38862 type:complete len:423 (-) Transcript_19617:142-1410(-)|eukprot:CAMPEP_0175136954 /NCGR_PEP_ID=MMETSP0087-20121206/9555_1 /TAXON_ID=136419 /ORGANISM="Unknown Unknown, Strain D1" /LENGTH=422 /DNA_ID=CAMNT_0016419753 /DNA_START=39 /DNA_END=1307 /DNA_ORIENTATION=-
MWEGSDDDDQVDLLLNGNFTRHRTSNHLNFDDRYVVLRAAEVMLPFVPYNLPSMVLYALLFGLAALSLLFAFLAAQLAAAADVDDAFAHRILIAVMLVAGVVLQHLCSLHNARSLSTGKIQDFISQVHTAGVHPLYLSAVFVALGVHKLTLVLVLWGCVAIVNGTAVMRRHHEAVVAPASTGPGAQLLQAAVVVAAATLQYLSPPASASSASSSSFLMAANTTTAAAGGGGGDAAVYWLFLLVVEGGAVLNAVNISRFYVQTLSSGFSQSYLPPHLRFACVFFAFSLLYLVGVVSRGVYVIGAVSVSIHVHSFYICRTVQSDSFSVSVHSASPPSSPSRVFPSEGYLSVILYFTAGLLLLGLFFLEDELHAHPSAVLTATSVIPLLPLLLCVFLLATAVYAVVSTLVLSSLEPNEADSASLA